MEAALRQREWQAQKFPARRCVKALRGCGSPEWLVAEAPRHALLSAAQSVIRWGHGITTCGLSDAGSVTFCTILEFPITSTYRLTNCSLPLASAEQQPLIEASILCRRENSHCCLILWWAHTHPLKAEY